MVITYIYKCYMLFAELTVGGKRDVYTFGSYRNIYPLIDNVLSVQMVGRDFDCNN